MACEGQEGKEKHDLQVLSFLKQLQTRYREACTVKEENPNVKRARLDTMNTCLYGIKGWAKNEKRLQKPIHLVQRWIQKWQHRFEQAASTVHTSISLSWDEFSDDWGVLPTDLSRLIEIESELWKNKMKVDPATLFSVWRNKRQAAESSPTVSIAFLNTKGELFTIPWEEQVKTHDENMYLFNQLELFEMTCPDELASLHPVVQRARQCYSHKESTQSSNTVDRYCSINAHVLQWINDHPSDLFEHATQGVDCLRFSWKDWESEWGDLGDGTKRSHYRRRDEISFELCRYGLLCYHNWERRSVYVWLLPASCYKY